MRAVEDRHWWYLGMRAIAGDLLAAHLPGGRAPRLILDAGCGTGGNAAALTRLGRVVGIDLSDLALELAAGRGLGGLVQASVERLPFGDATFDVVTSFEVLYHAAVPDDVAALAELRRVLRPGGLLLVRLPAFEMLRGAHDREVHTARRYRAPMLRARLEAAGLAPLRLTYANALLLPLVAARRVAERLIGARGDDLGETPRLLAALFRVALALERRLLRRIDLPAGVSLIALARRPGPA